MATIRAQVALKHSNGLPEDVTVNTFHFGTTAAFDAAVHADLIAALEGFYTNDPDAAGGAMPLYTFFSTEIGQNGHEIRFYDMADPEPRVPLHTEPFNLPAAPNGDPLPGEVAVVLSFQGVKVSGQPQARRRGRIFLGRLDKDCSSAGRPSTSLMTSLAGAGQALLTASDGAAGWSWGIYSAAFDGMTRDENGNVVPHPTREAYTSTFTAVDNGWVDNAFDTQRRRGLAASTRTTFS
jgi:hypothetical protein